MYFCNMIEDKNPTKTPLADLGEFAIIEQVARFNQRRSDERRSKVQGVQELTYANRR